MSARAAWRLETLGFQQVYRYTAGKADWFAAGWPIEGERAGVPRVGDLAHRDIPTCRLEERLGTVRARVLAGGWELCVVVNEQNVVLGRLKRDALDADPEATAETAMEAGPVTYRPNEVAAEAAKRLAERHVPSVLVTTSDGELIGLFRRDDVPGDAGERA